MLTPLQIMLMPKPYTEWLDDYINNNNEISVTMNNKLQMAIYEKIVKIAGKNDISNPDNDMVLTNLRLSNTMVSYYNKTFSINFRNSHRNYLVNNKSKKILMMVTLYCLELYHFNQSYYVGCFFHEKIKELRNFTYGKLKEQFRIIKTIDNFKKELCYYNQTPTNISDDEFYLLFKQTINKLCHP